MLYYENQLNLGNIYSDCSEMFKEQRPEFLELLNKYIDINSYIIKQNMGIAGRKTRDLKTTKADVFLAGIAQLFTVIVANAMAKPQYIRSIKKLAC